MCLLQISTKSIINVIAILESGRGALIEYVPKVSSPSEHSREMQ